MMGNRQRRYSKAIILDPELFINKDPEPREYMEYIPPNFDVTYPPVPGFDRQPNKYRMFHVGYVNSKAKPCPCCGTMPVFEQYVLDKAPLTQKRNIPAKTFVGICPRCEIRAEGEHTLEEALEVWNRGEYSEDSIICNRKMHDLDTECCANLCDTVIGDAMRDAVILIQKKKALMQELKNPELSDLKRISFYNELQDVRGNIREIQLFLRTSPIMFDRDSDAILSGIRKILHPELSYQERTKIPLSLMKM